MLFGGSRTGGKDFQQVNAKWIQEVPLPVLHALHGRVRARRPARAGEEWAARELGERGGGRGPLPANLSVKLNCWGRDISPHGGGPGYPRVPPSDETLRHTLRVHHTLRQAQGCT